MLRRVAVAVTVIYAVTPGYQSFADDLQQRMDIRDFIPLLDGVLDGQGTANVEDWNSMRKTLSSTCDFEQQIESLKGNWAMGLKGVCHLSNKGDPLYTLGKDDIPYEHPYDYPVQLLGAEVGVMEIDMTSPGNQLKYQISPTYDLTDPSYKMLIGKCLKCDGYDNRTKFYKTPKNHYISQIEDGGSGGNSFYFTFSYFPLKPVSSSSKDATISYNGDPVPIDDKVVWNEIEDEDKLSDNPQTGLQGVFLDNDSGPVVVLEATCTKTSRHYVKFQAIGFQDNTLKNTEGFAFRQGINSDGSVWQNFPYRYKVDSGEVHDVVSSVGQYNNVINDISAQLGDPRLGAAAGLENIDTVERLRAELTFDNGKTVLVDFSPRSETMIKFLGKCRSIAPQG